MSHDVTETFDPLDYPEVKPIEKLQKAMKAAATEHYANVTKAVSNAAKGENPLDIKELAFAIASGLYDWSGDQTEWMINLAEELCEQTDLPVSVVDKTIHE